MVWNSTLFSSKTKESFHGKLVRLCVLDGVENFDWSTSSWKDSKDPSNKTLLVWIVLRCPGHKHNWLVYKFPHTMKTWRWSYPTNRPGVPAMIIATIIYIYTYYTGWWFQPLWKIWKSVGMMKFPIYGKIKAMFQTTNQLYIININCLSKQNSWAEWRVPHWFEKNCSPILHTQNCQWHWVHALMSVKQ